MDGIGVEGGNAGGEKGLALLYPRVANHKGVVADVAYGGDGGAHTSQIASSTDTDVFVNR